MGVHGWVVLDKPLGLTSTQALGKVRSLVGGKKVGHAGTLDPLASGILPLAFGEATKIVPHVMDHDKDYEFTVAWGEQRSTDDAEGSVVATSAHRPTIAEMRAILPRFLGAIQQKPPAFSAIKVAGERAYDKARAGEAVDLAARTVMIHSLDFVGENGPDQALFRVTCGKGTYIRSLARDMAEALGTVGYVAALRRTRVGTFGLDRAISLEKLVELSHKGAANEALLALDAALDDILGLPLTVNEAQRLRNGQSLLIRPHQQHLNQSRIILATFQNVPVALVKAENGAFSVVRGFSF